MIFSEQEKKEILDSANQDILEIARKHIIIGSQSHLANIAGKTSGSLKFYPAASKAFNLILSKPSELAAFEWHEIRCCVCGSIIRQYPVWHLFIKYAVKHFHYFVCFQATPDNPETKPSTRCYRRD